MQPFGHNFPPPDRLCVHVWEERIFSKSMVIRSTWFSCMGLFLITRQAISMQPPALSCVGARICSRVCVQNTPPTTTYTLSLHFVSLLPSSSLSRWISLLPAATWSSLTEREGIKDSLISTQIKRHFGFHPTRRLAWARRTWSLCMFS